MKRSSNFPFILLACLFASMATCALTTAYAAQTISLDAVKNATGDALKNATATISGKVTDIITAGGLAYAQIDTGKEKIWAAGPAATPINKGDVVTFSTEMPMYNFHSKVLERDFSVIYFIKQFNTGNESVSKAAVEAQTSRHQADKPAPTASAGKPGEVRTGDYLREATLNGLNVDNKNISDFRGKPLIINMWASYCVPCRAEMASLERLAQRHNGKEFNIIGISIDDYRNKAEAFIEQTGITFDNFQDHKLLMENMLGASTIPLTVLVDDQGRIIIKVPGVREWDSPKIVAAIENAFKINLTP